MKKGLVWASALFFLWAVVPTSSAPAPDDPLPGLRKARLDAAAATYTNMVKLWKTASQHRAEDCYLWSLRILEGEKEAAKDRDATMAAYQAHLGRMIEVEKIATDLARPANRNEGPETVSATVYYRTEAELFLAQAKLKK